MSTAVKKRSTSLIEILQGDSFKRQIELALPKHLTPDRFLRIALTELRKNPKLMECDPKSFLGSIVQCSQLGLEPGDNLGQAYLIPFKAECQLIIGYKGLISLARRSGQLSSLQAHCVYENDDFDFEYGLEEKLKHIPTKTNRGELYAVYSVAKFKDGSYQFEVMFKEEIEKIRKTSKAAKSSFSPWNTHYEEMARKTAIRRIAKYLPLSPELATAVSIDERADIGKQSQDLELTLVNDTTGEIIEGLSFDEEIPKEEGTQSDKLLEALTSE